MSKGAAKISTGKFWIVFVAFCFVAVGIFSMIIKIQVVDHDRLERKGAEYSESVKTIDLLEAKSAKTVLLSSAFCLHS